MYIHSHILIPCILGRYYPPQHSVAYERPLSCVVSRNQCHMFTGMAILDRGLKPTIAT